jgi:mRNA-degrading endonuclease RelE of RelBE toxin-antitoxin system
VLSVAFAFICLALPYPALYIEKDIQRTPGGMRVLSMADESESENELTKTRVRRGGGPPPGYEWNVEILAQVRDESRDFLSEDQYAHLSRQVRELARHRDPTHSDTLDLRPVGNVFELRDKGGILRRLNVRVFYVVRPDHRTIVILGAFSKQNDGRTPRGDLWRMERRMRQYLEAADPS